MIASLVTLSLAAAAPAVSPEPFTLNDGLWFLFIWVCFAGGLFFGMWLTSRT
jgi:hypothetical protein